ncbi:unnamed protein product [Cuscuta campestris]|uniref:Uncharacterized protein n=1 Tax=Cuscuta campestris TaxID=132261 RepID=A0A484MV16_9ASTE|nr:unnamed protein product [Cuscuta campestris]
MHEISTQINPKKISSKSGEASWKINSHGWALSIDLPRPSIKGQALADFQVERIAREMTRTQADTRVEDDWWVMSIDGSSGSRSCGAGIVLITPENFRIYYAIRFQFRVSNNEAEYEALINGLKILGKLGVSRVQVYSDSRLVVGQITGEFEAKEERMKRYRDLSLDMLGRFEFRLEHIPRAQNAEADVLSKLSAESPEYIRKLATVEELATPSLNKDEMFWVSADPPEWLDRLAKYIEDGVAPEDPQEAHLLRMSAPTYKVHDGVLYKRSYNGVLLRCLMAAEAKALMEEIHEGVCAAHQGPYSISRRAIIQGFFWPTMRKDCEEYLRKCPTCQQFKNMPGRPATNYTPISSVIPFSRWGIDIVGALPKEVGQARWIVVAIDYFTKWVEAEPLAGITGRQMIDFFGTNILCRFGVPKQIISDNGTQFEEAEFQDFLKTWGIQHTKVSVAYPQANGQVENVNRTIISGIKKKLLSEGSKWVDELPRILWTYRTTPRRATGDTPFGLAYGFEVWAPAEAVIPTRREIEYDPEVNEQNQAVELNFVEERMDEAQIRAENYRRQFVSLKSALRRLFSSTGRNSKTSFARTAGIKTTAIPPLKLQPRLLRSPEIALSSRISDEMFEASSNPEMTKLTSMGHITRGKETGVSGLESINKHRIHGYNLNGGASERQASITRSTTSQNDFVRVHEREETGMFEVESLNQHHTHGSNFDGGEFDRRAPPTRSTTSQRDFLRVHERDERCVSEVAGLHDCRTRGDMDGVSFERQAPRTISMTSQREILPLHERGRSTNISMNTSVGDENHMNSSVQQATPVLRGKTKCQN